MRAATAAGALLCALALACNPPPAAVADGAAATDGAPRDLAAADLARPDAPSSPDGGAADLARPDAAAMDAAALDASPGDAIAADQAAPDATTGDAYSADALTWLSGVSCATPPPVGAALAPALPAYKGTCPTLKAGVNTISTSKAQRKFILVLPKQPLAGEKYPVIFMWHWLAGTASSFLKKGEIQAAADAQRFIAVIPEKKGDLKFLGLIDLPWPFATFHSQQRMDEEYQLFDDMLACVGKHFAVNRECVSTAGVSAGALFSNQLAAARSKHLSSFISLSGGVGSGGVSNNFVRKWKAPARKVPALVLWGGPQDSCILLNFELASKELEKQLTQQGAFFVECVHNCKHGEPPVTPPKGVSRYAPLWDFAFKHPYWLQGGASPYQLTGWDKKVISWCGLGASTAKVRSGSCGPPGCPI